ncbi:hypothetical protein NDU88_002372 [Pleurodeles waltl]|uniref:Uncharacterized protein n=1 Tax=Pleurodeles waltl TaxID=8319 RepID=A0AAV7T1V9_PLEWA|nr:hypothetical protein NDU88_002372 [Pleurodeles waltl]
MLVNNFALMEDDETLKEIGCEKLGSAGEHAEQAPATRGPECTPLHILARNRKQMALAAGFPVEPAQRQPVVFGWLLLALCDLNMLGQRQEKSSVPH